ncbi:sodium-coupled neutral amino acid transporter 9 homolog [Tachypleus tridentatus]|uniref:sodium-coupled neutral amino acid transporter 9 homolog n=1 Tax=Tachypleus tridentatus TaxID=6853 RepID=UPI003FD0012E
MDLKVEDSTPLLMSGSNKYDSMEKSSEGALLGSNSVEKVQGGVHPQPVQRRPFHYPSASNLGSINEDQSLEVSATLSRHRYYSKLADPSLKTLKIPDHIVPSYFFYPFPFTKVVGKQSSIVTIFSIWNTMMGTTLLTMPWAVQQAGFACSFAIMLGMCSVCLYTAYRIVKMPGLVSNASEVLLEFSDVARHLLGRWGEWCSVLFSLLTLLGSAIVYWVLLTNFTYYTVVYIYELSTGTSRPLDAINTTYVNVICDPSFEAIGNSTTQEYIHTSIFYEVWDIKRTVPLFLLIIVFPLINLKSPTFFSKFNALGTLAVFYLISFAVVKSAQWGIHFDLYHSTSSDFVSLYLPSFPALAGVSSMAFFIHNCILSLCRNQKNPENNVRDLIIAYVLVCLTYFLIGFLIFVSFPLKKLCIAENILNNFSSSDLMAFLTRVFLLFQVLTLFPLILYVLRIQSMHFLFGSIYPGFKHVVILNSFLVFICIMFAVFFPYVGTIIRFSGAISALSYVFTLPCITYLKAQKIKGTLKTTTIVLHGSLICLGIVNFVAQFFVGI